MPRDTHGKPVKMAHMERAKSKKKDGDVTIGSDYKEPDYPYGLRIHLDHDGMKKIGMSELPDVGGEVHLRAKAHVVGARSEKREGGEERHLELQITHLGVHHEADGFKSEDQGGSGKTPDAGHVTEKRDNSTSGRKRN